jgi:hypothetical protein
MTEFVLPDLCFDSKIVKFVPQSLCLDSECLSFLLTGPDLLLGHHTPLESHIVFGFEVL